MRTTGRMRYLLKIVQGQPGRVLHYNEALSKRKDMVECDQTGRPLTMVNTGIMVPPRHPKSATAALEQMELQHQFVDPVDAATVETDADAAVVAGGDLSKMDRPDIVALAKERFGADADHLKGNWSRDRLIEEFGRLEAMNDIKPGA